jgi:hypothetical protein
MPIGVLSVGLFLQRSTNFKREHLLREIGPLLSDSDLHNRRRIYWLAFCSAKTGPKSTSARP